MNKITYYLWNQELAYNGKVTIDTMEAAPQYSTLQAPPGEAEHCWHRLNRQWVDRVDVGMVPIDPDPAPESEEV